MEYDIVLKSSRDGAKNKIVGVDSIEGPPVPIPNTEVKLDCAENTWLETAREIRAVPTSTQQGGQASEISDAFLLYMI